jgi:putative hydrolase of the HAD superfamily
MKKILCFDLDDTLIDDNYKFELTFCDCIKAIINSLETRSPQIDDILKKAREIENGTWDTWPKHKLYTPLRVANAWVKAYEWFARDIGLPVREHTKSLIESLILSNYDPPYFVIPGVIETVTDLKEKGYEMHVVTLGLEQIQRRKLTVSKLIKYFDYVHYESYDKCKPLTKLKNKFGAENICMIGNSMRTDINPALNLDIDAIYIPRGNWHRFKQDPLNNKYKEITDIRELRNIF